MADPTSDNLNNMTCRLPILESVGDDDPLVLISPFRAKPCGGRLVLLEHNAYDLDNPRRRGLLSHSWEVACDNGHTLLLPPDDGNDLPVPFSPEALDALWRRDSGG